jgi:hypothetical protein
MAGSCVGPGLNDGPQGIQLYGPRSQAFPGAGGAGCSIDQANGLRLDPITEQLWTPPDPQFKVQYDHGTSSIIVPTFAHDTILTTLHLDVVAFDCLGTLVMLQLGSGTAHFRVGVGNYWAVTMNTVTKIDGATTFTPFGQPDWSPLNNTSGGVLTVGLTTAAVNGNYVINPGSTLSVDVTFTNNVFAYNADPNNELAWNPPDLIATSLSRPL